MDATEPPEMIIFTFLSCTSYIIGFVRDHHHATIIHTTSFLPIWSYHCMSGDNSATCLTRILMKSLLLLKVLRRVNSNNPTIIILVVLLHHVVNFKCFSPTRFQVFFILLSSSSLPCHSISECIQEQNNAHIIPERAAVDPRRSILATKTLLLHFEYHTNSIHLSVVVSSCCSGHYPKAIQQYTPKKNRDDLVRSRYPSAQSFVSFLQEFPCGSSTFLLRIEMIPI